MPDAGCQNTAAGVWYKLKDDLFTKLEFGLYGLK